MNKLDQFIVWIMSWIGLAIYVWGGQGETITSARQIYHMETSNVNALRAIVLWIKRGRNTVCFDCSGLLVSMLLKLKLIEYDTTADGLWHMCSKITRAQLMRGDWVFRVSNGKAYHIGVVVKIENGQIYIVEAMGRDDGVVMRLIDNHSVSGYWTDFGRPTIFKKEIEAAEPITPTPKSNQYIINGTGSGSSDGTGSKITKKNTAGKLIKTNVGAKNPYAMNWTGGAWVDAWFPSSAINLIPDPVPSICPYVTPTIEYADNILFVGKDARWYQWYLQRGKYDCGCTKGLDVHGTDGQAGPKTWIAIHKVQKKGIGRTGNAGPLTRALVNKL